MLTTLAASLTIAIANAAMPAPLAALKWNSRVLIVFTPTKDDARFQRQVRLLQDQDPALTERDVTVLAVTGEAIDTLRRRPVAGRAADVWRRSFDVVDQSFAIVLVGLDGSEKWRAQTPTPLETINSVIDSMPMRRANVQR